MLKNGYITAGGKLLSALQQAAHNHPKRVGTVLAAVLLGMGGASFAVASFETATSDVPVRQVLEAVQPLATTADNASALPFVPLTLYRSENTRANDTADTLLKRLGVQDPLAATFLRRNAMAQSGLFGRAGRSISVEANANGELLKLTSRWINQDSDTAFQRLTLVKDAKASGGFSAKVETAPLQPSSRLSGGIIRSNLFAATDEANITDAVAAQMIEIFSGQIDFHRALRKGDRFSVVFETLEADGEPLRTGRVLGTEIIASGKTYQALWFQEPVAATSAQAAAMPPQGGGYYTLNGTSLRRPYLASPLAFSRVTSGFSMRMHPILQRWREHLGVDYAAATGTPVRSVGDGVVEFAGVQNGFGNVVFIKHRNQHQTVYAHLSSIDVKQGQTVTQGQDIGAVGATGWATGPHLHFEFRVAGVHQDPLTIAELGGAIPLSASAKTSFERLAKATRVQLNAGLSIQQASAQ